MGDESRNDLRIYICDWMCFIDDSKLEAEYFEGDFLDEANFVTRDTNFEILSRFAMICVGSSFVPARTTMFTWGVHSHAQFWRVDLGTTIRCGPAIPGLCMRRREILINDR